MGDGETEFMLAGDEPEMPQMGYMVIQSAPLTEAEGQMWLGMVARCFPDEMFTKFSWLPILPGDPN